MFFCAFDLTTLVRDIIMLYNVIFPAIVAKLNTRETRHIACNRKSYVSLQGNIEFSPVNLFLSAALSTPKYHLPLS